MKGRRGLHGTVVVRIALPPSTRAPSADGAHPGRPAVLEIRGLDLHQRESQLSRTADDGTITDRRIATSRERFTAVVGARPRARMLLEASTEREWVARHLESLGHDVIVADPNDAPMSANRSRRTKTDKREQIAAADRRIAAVAANDPIVARLATAPGVGPVTASAFVATIDDQHAVLFGRVRV